MKRRWIVAGTAALGVALWFGLPALARKMEFFRVRRVEFIGMRYLSPETTLEAPELPAGLNVFDDLEPFAERARGIPGVAAASDRRGRLVLMDSAGRVLPYDPRRTAPELPVASGPDAVVAGLLRRMQSLDPGLFGRIDGAARAGDDVVLLMGGRRVLFRPDASFEEMRAVKAVAEDLARKGATYAELDGRYAEIGR